MTMNEYLLQRIRRNESVTLAFIKLIGALLINPISIALITWLVLGYSGILSFILCYAATYVVASIAYFILSNFIVGTISQLYAYRLLKRMTNSHERDEALEIMKRIV